MGITSDKMRAILLENGYRRYIADEVDEIEHNEGTDTFGWKHIGDYYKEFGECMVAFKVTDNDNGKPSVWLSIEYCDGKVETDIYDLRVANMFLTLMDAEPLRWRYYDGRLD